MGFQSIVSAEAPVIELSNSLPVHMNPVVLLFWSPNPSSWANVWRCRRPQSDRIGVSLYPVLGNERDELHGLSLIHSASLQSRFDFSSPPWIRGSSFPGVAFVRWYDVPPPLNYDAFDPAPRIGFARHNPDTPNSTQNDNSPCPFSPPAIGYIECFVSPCRRYPELDQYGYHRSQGLKIVFNSVNSSI